MVKLLDWNDQAIDLTTISNCGQRSIYFDGTYYYIASVESMVGKINRYNADWTNKTEVSSKAFDAAHDDFTVPPVINFLTYKDTSDNYHVVFVGINATKTESDVYVGTSADGVTWTYATYDTVSYEIGGVDLWADRAQISITTPTVFAYDNTNECMTCIRSAGYLNSDASIGVCSRGFGNADSREYAYLYYDPVGETFAFRAFSGSDGLFGDATMNFTTTNLTDGDELDFENSGIIGDLGTVLGFGEHYCVHLYVFYPNHFYYGYTNPNLPALPIVLTKVSTNGTANPVLVLDWDTSYLVEKVIGLNQGEYTHLFEEQTLYFLDSTDLIPLMSWGNYLVDTTGNLYKLEPKTSSTSIQKCVITENQYSAPRCNYDLLVKPIINTFTKMYDISNNLIYVGYIEDYDFDIEKYTCRMRSPIGQDFERKVEKSYTAQTAHAILKDIIDTYCLFIYYDTHIDTTPVTTYSIDFKSKSVLDVIQWCDKIEGYLTTIRPDGNCYYDQGTASGKSIEVNVDLVTDAKYNNQPLKLSYIKIFGGWNPATGKRFVSEKLGEPNFGQLIDWFPEIDNQTDLDLIRDKILVEKNTELETVTLKGVKGKNPLYLNQTYTLTASRFSITADTHYVSKTVLDCTSTVEILTDLESNSALYTKLNKYNNITKQINNLNQYTDDINTNKMDKTGTSTQTLSLKVNEASALDITEGANSYLKFTTTVGSEKITVGKEFAMGTNKITGLGDPTAAQDADVLLSTLYGYFPAAYNFKSDTVGNVPSGWTKTSGTFQIATEFVGHKNVLQLTDDGADGRGYIDLAAQTNPTVEFYMGYGAIGQGEFYLTSATGGSPAVANIFGVVGMQSILGVETLRVELSHTQIDMTVTANRMYHIRVYLNTSTNKISVWVDNVLFVNAANNYNNNVLASLQGITILNRNATSFYVDAIDFSWSSGYFTNRNYPAYLMWMKGQL